MEKALICFWEYLQPQYIRKIIENYHKNREDSMTKIIATHIRNINETFIDISMDILSEYISS